MDLQCSSADSMLRTLNDNYADRKLSRITYQTKLTNDPPCAPLLPCAPSSACLSTNSSVADWSLLVLCQCKQTQ